MLLNELNINLLTKLSSQQVDHVTCLECCKYYIAPTTAACGHTLCHGCWRGRRKCPICEIPVVRKNLQLNLPLKNLTDHIHLLVEALEKLFNIKLDEFSLDVPNQLQQEQDPTKNVKDWLANSQNHFSAPVSSQSTQDLNPRVEYLTSKIQIHTNNVKNTSPAKVLHIPLPQHDWDKIELMPDTDECSAKKQQNVIGPMDIEPFVFDDNQYTTEKPRRSTRNKDTDSSIKHSHTNDIVTENFSAKTSTIASCKPSNKIKQTWTNVKRMKKEFSRLNKENRNKLNVSIEMCKKTQISNSNTKLSDKEKPIPDIIEADTPNFSHKDKESEEKHLVDKQLTFESTVREKSDLDPTLAISINNSNRESVTVITKDIDRNLMIQEKNVISQDKSTIPMDIENKSINEIETEKSKVKFFKKSTLQINTKEQNMSLDNKYIGATSTDDIEISIKIGTTITNICIKKKENDIQLKINTDREIQTSVEKGNTSTNNIFNSNSKGNSQNIQIKLGDPDPINTITQIKNGHSINNPLPNQILNRSVSTKKNTASADTGTAYFEITESVEKELSDIMECVEHGNVQEDFPKEDCALKCHKSSKADVQSLQSSSQKENIPEDNELNDLDIFDCESKTPSVQLLKTTKNMPSKILVITQSKNKHKQSDKRDRDLNNDEELPQKKKQKIFDNNVDVEKVNTTIEDTFKVVNDSESNNYDVIMGKVFANIDADMATVKQDEKISKKCLHNDEKSFQTLGQIKNNYAQQNLNLVSQHGNTNENQKYSENIFSILENDNCRSKNSNTQVKPTQHNIESLTPNICREFASVHEDNREIGDIEMIELGTPFQENDDSDKSVVEETPQKNISIPKIKQKTELLFPMENEVEKQPKILNLDGNKQSVKSIINLSDTITDSSKTTKETTVVETAKGRQTLETPLTINKFVDQIKHKSTPMARKSLNFNLENIEDIDPEQTLCPSSIAVAKTTQEKEFMNEVFEQSPYSPVYKTLPVLKSMIRPTKFCVAGSCLTSSEIMKVKLLCKERGWSYVDKYTKDLTHLVVSVDEENRSQRSVKYMCALAAGKWIISYEWAEKCTQTKTVIPEEPYEALDGTGEPGPRRSRLAKQKLFQGIAFYCMQPFSVLNIETLKEILEAAGGRVVNDATEVRVVDEKPALFLAEPEHTQEDRFIYLAMELKIVPVNYEWVLNCLGSYTLGSIHELLLCPSSLLPPVTNKWPSPLVAREFD